MTTNRMYKQFRVRNCVTSTLQKLKLEIKTNSLPPTKIHNINTGQATNKKNNNTTNINMELFTIEPLTSYFGIFILWIKFNLQLAI
jgi:hypothetical protein